MGIIELAKFDADKIQQILYEIRVAVDRVQQQKFNENELEVSMPKYFSELLIRFNLEMTMGFSTSDKTEIFGCKVVNSFDNFIVVYHPDMPLRQNTNYVIINLK